MRLRWLACAALISVALGCGGTPSGTNLFTGKKCAPGALVACSGANDCAGHAICGPGEGQLGNCICDGPMGAGGIVATGGVVGAGGIIALGGSGGEGGFSTGGASGSSATGGFPTGGFGGVSGSGGEGGATGTCPAGHYSGSYMGTYGIGQQVSGTVEFTVDSSGTVTGTYTGTNPNNGSKADLTGTLNCTTLELTMSVENGTYTVLISTVKFSGTMPGTYSAETHSFSGTWSISDSSSQTGKGTWTAQ